MELQIKKMTFDNFRGFTHKEIEFDGNSKILGANAQGKTTCFFGWMWLMSGKSDALTTDPLITPKGMNECVSKVEAEITIDGKPCTIAKTQKYKEKTDDTGKTTSKTDNSFTINGVEKTATNFVADLKERGIDMDNFLMLSHVFAFTADTSKKGREEMRKVLFEMVDGVSDLDIAKEIDVPNVTAELEKGYKIEEVEQMAKSSLKALNDKYGKQNELIDSKISGIIESKSTLDGKVLEQQKANYESEIERIEKELESISGNRAEISDKIAELKIKKNEIESEQNKELFNDKEELSKQIRTYKQTIDENNFQLEQANKNLERAENKLAENNEDIKKQRTLYKVEQDAVLDEGDLSCPYCNRTYEKAKLDEIKSEFEQKKTERLKLIKSTGDTLKAEIKVNEDDVKAIKEKCSALTKTIEETQKMLDKVQAEFDSLPQAIDFEKNPKWCEVSNELTELEQELAKSSTDHENELNSQKNVNKQMLNQVIAELGSLERNKELDNKIADLRQTKKDAEIQRANHEKMIYQVEVFKKAKNNKLSSQINSHFNGVEFVFWEYLKNGNINETLKVLIDGKEINTQVNQASQIKAKLEIIRGLSVFFKQYFPIFIDDASLLTQETLKTIDMPNQMIWLCAVDGKELEVVKGE